MNTRIRKISFSCLTVDLASDIFYNHNNSCAGEHTCTHFVLELLIL